MTTFQKKCHFAPKKKIFACSGQKGRCAPKKKNSLKTIIHLRHFRPDFKRWSFGAENFFLPVAGRRGATRPQKKKIAKNDHFLKSGQKLLKYDLIYKNIPSTATFDRISKKMSFCAEKKNFCLQLYILPTSRSCTYEQIRKFLKKFVS